MTPFNAITPGDFIDADALALVIESFAGFYHNVTPKHQKRSRLSIIGGEEHLQMISDLRNKHELGDALVILTAEDEEAIRELYKEADVLFMPVKKMIGKVIPEALSFGLPILCYDTEDLREELDHTCGMFVTPYKMINHCIDEFTEKINMLYFDPEVRKILSKGAFKKYKDCYEWGRSEVMMAAVAN
ncbi:MAG: glycosyltransferase [Bacteroidota bacterium]